MEKEAIVALIQKRLGLAEKEFKQIVGTPKFQRLFENVADAARYQLVAEVVESKGCHSGHVVGQRLIFDSAGNFVGSFAVVTDITQCKEFEETLKETNDRLEAKQAALVEKNIALKEVLSQIEHEKKRTGLQLQGNVDRIVMPIVQTLRTKAAANLQPPAMTAFLRYSAKLRTDALLKLGFVSVLKLIGRLAPGKEQRARSGRLRALQGNVRRMKKLTEDALVHQCKNYRENLKFAYLYKLVELMAVRLTESLLESFQVYGNDAQAAGEGISQHQSDKERTVETLTDMADSADEVSRRIDSLRSDVSRMSA